MTLRQAVPSLITLFALGCGLGAIEATRVGNWDLALRLILLAAIADGIDGPIARRLNGSGAMGKQLDSLSDIVSFGAAPAFLFSTHYASAPDAARFGVALAFVATGAYRLARFNAQPTNDVFLGLPITVAGALLAVTVAGPFSLGVVEASLIAMVLAVLMVGRHPFPTFAKWRWTLLPAMAASAVAIALWPRVETLAIAAGAIFAFYVVWGLVGRLIEHFREDDLEAHLEHMEEEVPGDVGPHA